LINLNTSLYFWHIYISQESSPVVVRFADRKRERFGNHFTFFKSFWTNYLNTVLLWLSQVPLLSWSIKTIFSIQFGYFTKYISVHTLFPIFNRIINDRKRFDCVLLTPYVPLLICLLHYGLHMYLMFMYYGLHTYLMT